jgi:hypothetical protein
MKMDEAGYEYVDWLQVAEDRFQWLATCFLESFGGYQFPKTPLCRVSSIFKLDLLVTLTLRSRALLEGPPVVRPLDSFPAFYGTRSFITAFTRAPHLPLS